MCANVEITWLIYELLLLADLLLWCLGCQFLAEHVEVVLVGRSIKDLLIFELIVELDVSEASESLLLALVYVHILEIW